MNKVNLKPEDTIVFTALDEKFLWKLDPRCLCGDNNIRFAVTFHGFKLYCCDRDKCKKLTIDELRLRVIKGGS